MSLPEADLELSHRTFYQVPVQGSTLMSRRSRPQPEAKVTASSLQDQFSAAPTQASAAVDQPLPRPQRRRRRDRSDRGLPADIEVARLAIAYLDRQRKHWPEMVKAGVL